MFSRLSRAFITYLAFYGAAVRAIPPRNNLWGENHPSNSDIWRDRRHDALPNSHSHFHSPSPSPAPSLISPHIATAIKQISDYPYLSMHETNWENVINELVEKLTSSFTHGNYQSVLKNLPLLVSIVTTHPTNNIKVMIWLTAYAEVLQNLTEELLGQYGITKNEIDIIQAQIAVASLMDGKVNIDFLTNAKLFTKLVKLSSDTSVMNALTDAIISLEQAMHGDSSPETKKVAAKNIKTPAKQIDESASSQAVKTPQKNKYLAIPVNGQPHITEESILEAPQNSSQYQDYKLIGALLLLSAIIGAGYKRFTTKKDINFFTFLLLRDPYVYFAESDDSARFEYSFFCILSKVSNCTLQDVVLDNIDPIIPISIDQRNADKYFNGRLHLNIDMRVLKEKFKTKIDCHDEVSFKKIVQKRLIDVIKISSPQTVKKVRAKPDKSEVIEAATRVPVKMTQLIVEAAVIPVETPRQRVLRIIAKIKIHPEIKARCETLITELEATQHFDSLPTSIKVHNYKLTGTSAIEKNFRLNFNNFLARFAEYVNEVVDLNEVIAKLEAASEDYELYKKSKFYPKKVAAEQQAKTPTREVSAPLTTDAPSSPTMIVKSLAQSVVAKKFFKKPAKPASVKSLVTVPRVEYQSMEAPASLWQTKPRMQKPIQDLSQLLQQARQHMTVLKSLHDDQIANESLYHYRLQYHLILVLHAFTNIFLKIDSDHALVRRFRNLLKHAMNDITLKDLMSLNHAIYPLNNFMNNIVAANCFDQLDALHISILEKFMESLSQQGLYQDLESIKEVIPTPEECLLQLSELFTVLDDFEKLTTNSDVEKYEKFTGENGLVIRISALLEILTASKFWQNQCHLNPDLSIKAYFVIRYHHYITHPKEFMPPWSYVKLSRICRDINEIAHVLAQNNVEINMKQEM